MATLRRHQGWTLRKTSKRTHCSRSSIGEAMHVTAVVEASQASQLASQVGSKPPVARKMGRIKGSTSVLSIANYMELRRTKVNRKELKIE